MLNEETVRSLRKMYLSGMADEYKRQIADPTAASLSFDARLGLMVDAEFSKRGNNRLAKLIKNAGFTDRQACVENITYDADRKLDVNLIQQLASCAFIEKRHNVQILGPTGSGKTFIANALGISACRKSYTVKYTTLQEMISNIMIAHETNNMAKVFGDYAKVSLLIIDDWLMFDVNDDNEAMYIYKMLEARKYSGSMIFCSQIDAAGWHGRIANKVAADSICDRLVHSSYRLKVEGEMRKKLAVQPTSKEA